MKKPIILPALVLLLGLLGGCADEPQKQTEGTGMNIEQPVSADTNTETVEQPEVQDTKAAVDTEAHDEEGSADIFAAFFPDRQDGSIPDGRTFNELASTLASGVQGRLTEVTYTFKNKKITMETLAGNRDIQEEKHAGEEERLQLVYDDSEYYDYVLYLPEGYDPSDQDTKWPVIYFFHGIGEKGEDLNELLAYGVPKYIQDGGRLEAIMIAPQCPEDSHWADTDVEEERIKLFIAENTSKFRIDEDRIYATGLSMGGRCTWKQALAMPDTFAAALVVCGRTNTYDFSEILDMPIWMFHGAMDDTVAFANVNRIVTELYGQGHEYFKLTVYPYLSHDSWTSTYARPDIYDWLLAQNRADRTE